MKSLPSLQVVASEEEKHKEKHKKEGMCAEHRRIYEVLVQEWRPHLCLWSPVRIRSTKEEKRECTCYLAMMTLCDTPT